MKKTNGISPLTLSLRDKDIRIFSSLKNQYHKTIIRVAIGKQDAFENDFIHAGFDRAKQTIGFLFRVGSSEGKASADGHLGYIHNVELKRGGALKSRSRLFPFENVFGYFFIRDSSFAYYENLDEYDYPKCIIEIWLGDERDIDQALEELLSLWPLPELKKKDYDLIHWPFGVSRQAKLKLTKIGA